MTDLVYFIRPVGAEGPVKIGYSRLPPKRLAEISTWAPVPLEIAATVPGGANLERNLHNCFADQHSHREWFHASPRLSGLIASLAGGAELSSVFDLTDLRGNIISAKAKKRTHFWSTSPEAKVFLSLQNRLRHALKRTHLAWAQVPVSVRGIVIRSKDRPLTPEERAEVEAYLAAPFPRLKAA